MAVFPSFKLTEKGEELLNRSIGEGKTLTFTKFELGDGNPPSDFRKQTGLVNKFYEFPILNTSIQKDQVLRIKGYFDNKSFLQDKQLKEIGVFVKIEGNETQYLYSYTNAGDTGDIIPANSRGFYSRTLDVANYIGYATNITFNIEQLRDRYAFNTENEMKVASYLKVGDKVELWGNLVLGDKPTDEYIIQESGEIELSNGLFAKKVSFKYIAQTIEEMQKLALKVGDIVEVLGYYQAGDGAGHKRKIVNSDDGSGVQLENGLYANIVHNSIVHSNWFGANKSGDTTDIFKKIVAYNKPTIIDYGTYTITDYIFMEDNKILKDYGTYTDKYVIRSLQLDTNNPKRELIGVFDLRELGNSYKEFGTMQGFLYDTKRKYYVIGFANDFSGSTLSTSTIAVYDENFNFVKKTTEYNYGHCDGLIYVSDTDEYMLVNRATEKVAVLDPETLKQTREVDLGYNPFIMFYCEDLKMIGTHRNSTVKLYDTSFNFIKEITLKVKQIAYQTTTYFKGYFVLMGEDGVVGSGNSQGTKFALTFYDLKGDLKYFYTYDKEVGREPEGIVPFGENQLLMSDYYYNRQYARMYKLDFSAHTHNFSEIITNSTTNTTSNLELVVYIDSNAAKEGDGTQNSPFKTISYAILQSKKYLFNSLKVLLKGEFNEQLVSIENFSIIKFNKWGDENPTIRTSIIVLNSSFCEFYNINFDRTKDNNCRIVIDGTNGAFQNCSFTEYELSETAVSFIRVARGTYRIIDNTFNNSNKSIEAVSCTLFLARLIYNNCNYRMWLDFVLAKLYSMSSQGLKPDKYGKDSEVFDDQSVTLLNTPYHTTKMAQEGGTTLTDFYSYLDEKYAYDKQLEAEQKAKYEAYELLLKDNPNLTWEEFEQTYGNTSMMNRRKKRSLVERLEEPVIPESVKKFMEKYL